MISFQYFRSWDTVSVMFSIDDDDIYIQIYYSKNWDIQFFLFQSRIDFKKYREASDNLI